MKNLLIKLLPVILVFGFLALTPAAHASTTADGISQTDFLSSGTNGDATGLSSTLQTVTKYALYIFYLLGIIFMGVAAVKFKNGDMEAMGKNLGGAVCLFLVPKIVQTIILWASA